MSQSDINDIIDVYDSKIIKAYCWARFKILQHQFLDEIGQYLPNSGHILDIGCGFGFFSLYYAKQFPNLEILGIDINAVRIKMAKQAAKMLSLSNVNYEVANVISYECCTSLDGAYMFDIVHHIPRKAVLPLVKQLHKKLNQGCRLIIKDVQTKPDYKRWVTYILDKIMNMQAEVNYWEYKELMNLIKNVGFEVFYHSMADLLPYSHILYICQKDYQSS